MTWSKAFWEFKLTEVGKRLCEECNDDAGRRGVTVAVTCSNGISHSRGQQTEASRHEIKKQTIKVSFPPMGTRKGSSSRTSRVYAERTWRAWGLFCTCSVGDDDVGWHIACRERGYCAEQCVTFKGSCFLSLPALFVAWTHCLHKHLHTQTQTHTYITGMHGLSMTNLCINNKCLYIYSATAMF